MLMKRKYSIAKSRLLQITKKKGEKRKESTHSLRIYAEFLNMPQKIYLCDFILKLVLK